MLKLDRIGVSEGIYVNKTLLVFFFFFCWKVSTGCLQWMSWCINDANEPRNNAILNIPGVDYWCIINGKAVKLLIIS